MTNYIGVSEILFFNKQLSLAINESLLQECFPIRSSQLLAREILHGQQYYRVELLCINAKKYAIYVESFNQSGSITSTTEVFDDLAYAKKVYFSKLIAFARWYNCIQISPKRYEVAENVPYTSLWGKIKPYLNTDDLKKSTITKDILDTRLSAAKKHRYYGEDIQRYTSILMSPICESASMYRCIDIGSKADNINYVQLWSMHKKVTSDLVWIVSRVNKMELVETSNPCSTCYVFENYESAYMEYLIQGEIDKVRGFVQLDCGLVDIEDKRECHTVLNNGEGNIKLYAKDELWWVEDTHKKTTLLSFPQYVKAERYYVEKLYQYGMGMTLEETIGRKETTKKDGLSKESTELDKLLTRLNTEMHAKYNHFCGKELEYGMKLLSEKAIQKGMDILNQIEKIAVKHKHTLEDKQMLKALSLQYYQCIPRDWKSTRCILDTVADVDREYQVLDLYSNVFKYKLSDKLNDLKKSLNYVIDAVTENDEYKEIKKWVESTAIHNYKINVKKIYKLESLHSNAYDTSVGNDTLLFHGTGSSNVYPILCSHLRVPKGHGMFGAGIYFADKASKSANYSFGYWGNTSRSAKGYLLVASVALGKVKHYYDGQSQLKEPPRGYNSVKGCKGNHLCNDEFIVYKENQAQLKYLIEIEKYK